MAQPNVSSCSSAAVEGLLCSVCGEPAHGQHFGVITCRPCSSFFRRCIVERLTYKCIRGTNSCNVKIGTRKRCKACRFMICQRTGMKFRRKYGGNGDQEEGGEEEEEEDNDESDADNPQDQRMGGANGGSHLLEKFMATHGQFMSQQQSLFLALYGENGHQEINMIIPETELAFRRMEQGTRPMLISMLEKAIPPFGRLEKEIKHSLFDDCFDQLNLLNAAFLSLEQFPWEEDSHFLIAFGLVMDLDLLEEITAQWANSSHVLQEQEKYQKKKCEQMKGNYAFIRQLKKMPQKLTHQDFCAMMAIFVLIRALSQIDLSMDQYLDWENFRERISSQWLQSLNAVFNSQYLATMQMSRLLSILHQLDIYCRNFKKKPAGPPSLLQICASENLLNKFSRESNEIKSFCRLATCYRRIWGAFMDLADNYLDKFSKLEDLLLGSDNLLGLAETFKSNPSAMLGTERSKLFFELSQMYKTHQYHPRIMKSTIVYRLLAIGILKAMPVFKHLSPSEKTYMVRQLRLPINFFINSFFAAELGSKTWMGTDGLTPMELFRSVPEYKNDERFIFLVDRAFSRCVDPFLRVPLLKKEEFALLLAILCCYPAIFGLSKHSQDLLYTEQVRLSQLLLRYLQMRLGHGEGAKRYAECLHLVDSAFGSAQNFEVFITYVETFHMKHGYSLGFPKSISAVV